MTHSARPFEIPDYEVLIIGGGAAGLSAALTFGRLRRNVLICDDQRPRNKPAAHMNNFPGFDGVSPEIWRQQVRSELHKYPSIKSQSTQVTHLLKTETGFEAHLSSGDTVTAHKVLLAYGISDDLPKIPNLETLWGDTVAHCPFCHGFEFQDQPTALLGDGDMVLHLLALLSGLSSDLYLLTNGPSQLTHEQKQKITAHKIPIIETPVRTLSHSGSKLEAIVFENGESIPISILYITPRFPFARKSRLGEALGCQVNEFGWYTVDDFGQTSVAGVYAAGDIAGMHGQSVLNSAAFGSRAAAHIIANILTEKNGFH